MIGFSGALATGMLTLALAGSGLAPAAPSTPAEEIGLSFEESGEFGPSLSRPVYENIRAVPGDHDARSFLVRNESTMPGNFTATLVNVRVTGDPRDPYYSEFLVNDVSAAERLGKESVIQTGLLAPGETAKVTVGYDLPASVTVGNYPADDPRAVAVSFDVRIDLSGQTPPVSPSPSPSASIVTSTPTPSSTPGPGTGKLVDTGATGVAGMIAGAGILVAGGFILRRRNRVHG